MSGGNEIRATWPVAIQEKLAEMEELHRRSPHDRNVMLRVARFLLAQGDINEALKYMRRAGSGLASEKNGHVIMVQVGATYMLAWHVMKSVNPMGDMEEVYMGDDRSFLLAQANNYFQQAIIVEEVRTDPASLLQAAFAKECCGDFSDALNMLSDIITNHQDYDALPAVIFKAGSILSHGGELNKAKEYLEFLEDVDLPPSGLSYSLYYAQVVIVYEELSASDKGMARKVQAQLKNAWVSLQKWFVDERRDNDDEKYGAIRRLSKEDFQCTPIVWVDLSMECLHNCQYLLAAQFLMQAIARVPHVDLLLLLAECLWVLKQTERAIATLEKAHQMDELHIRIRQLLSRWASLTYGHLLKEEEHQELEAVPERFVQGRRRSSIIRSPPPPAMRPGTAERRPQTAERKADARPGTAQSDKSSRPGTAQSGEKRTTVRRKAVLPERSLFKDVNETEVRQVYKKVVENKMDYTYDNEVLRALSEFHLYKTKYEVANTRIRLKHKFKTPGGVGGGSGNKIAVLNPTAAAVAPSTGQKAGGPGAAALTARGLPGARTTTGPPPRVAHKGK